MIPLRDDQKTNSFPFATVLLIAVNAYVFAGWQMHTGVQASVDEAGFVPVELSHHEPGAWTHVFTGMFMHGGWMHLIGNMWFLWIFGHGVEEACGHFRFLCFYLLCGVASTLAFSAMGPNSDVPLVGASGAISGVLGAYLLHYPAARVLTLVPLGPFIRLMQLPAWLFLLIWIGIQVFFQIVASRHGSESSGVAYAAHIGGFVAGLGLIFFFEKRSSRG